MHGMLKMTANKN